MYWQRINKEMCCSNYKSLHQYYGSTPTTTLHYEIYVVEYVSSIAYRPDKYNWSKQHQVWTKIASDTHATNIENLAWRTAPSLHDHFGLNTQNKHSIDVGPLWLTWFNFNRSIIVITPIIKRGMHLVLASQTWTLVPLKFWNHPHFVMYAVIYTCWD